MKQYTSETGKFVILDDSGKVVGKASVPAGTHVVDDDVDPENIFDIRENDNEHVAEYLEDSPANSDIDPSKYGAADLLEQIELDEQDDDTEGEDDEE